MTIRLLHMSAERLEEATLCCIKDCTCSVFDVGKFVTIITTTIIINIHAVVLTSW